MLEGDAAAAAPDRGEPRVGFLAVTVMCIAVGRSGEASADRSSPRCAAASVGQRRRVDRRSIGCRIEGHVCRRRILDAEDLGACGQQGHREQRDR
jgi:hypothetical protein